MRALNRKFISLLIPTAIAAAGANANTLAIHNKNDKEIKVVIQAEGGMTENLPYIKQTVAPNSTAEVKINRDALGNKDTFFVRGRAGTLSLPTTCEHLSVDNDYAITFNEGWTGPTYKVQRARK